MEAASAWWSFHRRSSRQSWRATTRYCRTRKAAGHSSKPGSTLSGRNLSYWSPVPTWFTPPQRATNKRRNRTRKHLHHRSFWQAQPPPTKSTNRCSSSNKHNHISSSSSKSPWKPRLCWAPLRKRCVVSSAATNNRCLELMVSLPLHRACLATKPIE